MRHIRLRPATTTWVICLTIWLCGFVATHSARAQSQITTGVIQGTIMDESGAVVPGTNVEVKNLDTNAVQTFSTNDAGRFVFLQLPPGRYTLTAARPALRRSYRKRFH